jgi:hypothetical protein
MGRLIILAMILLAFGCVSAPSENITNEKNVSPPLNVPPENLTPITSGNITETPEPPPPNLTNQNNITNQTNKTGETNAPVVPGVPPAEIPERPKGLAFGGKYLLVLDDVSIIPTSDEPCGIFSILDSSDYSVLDKEIICPGESKMFSGYRIFVVKVAAGYSGQGNWADVRIYG